MKGRYGGGIVVREKNVKSQARGEIRFIRVVYGEDDGVSRKAAIFQFKLKRDVSHGHVLGG